MTATLKEASTPKSSVAEVVRVCIMKGEYAAVVPGDTSQASSTYEENVKSFSLCWK